MIDLVEHPPFTMPAEALDALAARLAADIAAREAEHLPRGTDMREPKMRHCFNCGAEMGVYADYDPLDDCGAQECQRAVRDAYAQERDEAHEQLDRDMGWF